MTEREIVEVMARAIAGNVTEAQMKANPREAKVAREDARNVLAALKAAKVRIVPEEPTEAMLDAGGKAAWELNGAEYASVRIFGPWEKADDLTRKRSARAFKHAWPAMLLAASKENADG